MGQEVARVSPSDQSPAFYHPVHSSPLCLNILRPPGPQKGDCFRDKGMFQLEWTLLYCIRYSKVGGETRQNSPRVEVPDKANHAVRRGRKAKGLAHPHLRKPGCRRNGPLLWGPALCISIEPAVRV